MIVVVDEAQNLEPEVLETLRLLSNFETAKTKLMHIILAGQPALAQKLSTPSLVQLRQRISIVQGLAPLPAWEVKNYVEHRLRIAGYRGSPIFANELYESITTATEGIPRNVNNFCFSALSVACALRRTTVDAEVVKEVMADLDIRKLAPDTLSPPTIREPHPAIPLMPNPETEPEIHREITNAAEAAAYMQQIALKLRNWRESIDKVASGAQDPKR